MSLNFAQIRRFGARSASSPMTLPTTTRWCLRRLRGVVVLDRCQTHLRGMPAGRGHIDKCRKQFCCALLSQGSVFLGGGGEHDYGHSKFHGGSSSPSRSRSRSWSKSGAFETVYRDEWSVNKGLQAFGNWTWPGFTRTHTGQRTMRRDRFQDDGDWRYSPEWWGTQAGGWGRNKGETVFEITSAMSNGVVSVTAHQASTPVGSKPSLKRSHQAYGRYQQRERDIHSAQGQGQKEADEALRDNDHFRVLGYEWRVLRFNDVTRQSVAKVKAISTSSGDVILLQQPNCIAFEYIKSMISVGLVAVSLSGLDLRSVKQRHSKMRILCVGLGGGSLPLFLAHSLPGATVEVVEIDGAVIAAAIESMGFPPSYAPDRFNGAGSATEDHARLWGDILERIIVHEEDGDAFVRDQAIKAATENTESLKYDLIFVDAFDGKDRVPSAFWDRNGSFLRNLSSLLSVEHGAVVVNLHTDSAPPTFLERISGKFGPGFDPTLPQGSRVQEAALAYRDVLLRNLAGSWPTGADQSDPHMESSGLAFTISVAFQGNVSLVVCRGALPSGAGYDDFPDYMRAAEDSVIQIFMSEADRIQDNLQIPFELSKRVSRGFQIVK